MHSVAQSGSANINALLNTLDAIINDIKTHASGVAYSGTYLTVNGVGLTYGDLVQFLNSITAIRSKAVALQTSYNLIFSRAADVATLSSSFSDAATKLNVCL